MRSLIAILATVFLAGCGWGVDPYGNLYTTTRPKKEDVPGTYLLTGENISKSGPSNYQFRQCQLDLHPDGTFTVTNYPTWKQEPSRDFVAFISTTGRWSCESVGGGIDGTNHYDIWGVRFSDADKQVRQMGLTGGTPPYGMLMHYGDPDWGK